MLDYDLAELYDVPTKALNQAVKRNIKRFPDDFMFRLSVDEWAGMRSQIVTASQTKEIPELLLLPLQNRGWQCLAEFLAPTKQLT